MRRSLLLLSGDNSGHLVALFEGTAVLTKASTSHLDGLLLLDGDLSADAFNHLALVRG